MCVLGGSALSLWIMGNCASEGSTITRVLRMPHVGRGSRLARVRSLAATDLLLCPPNSTCVHVAALRAVSFALLIAVVYVGACVDGCRRSCRRPVSAVGLAADAAVMSAPALELPHLTPFPPRRSGGMAENGISLPFARGALPRPSRCSHRSIRSPGGSENGRRHFPAIFLWIASPPRRVLGSWSGCEINR